MQRDESFDTQFERVKRQLQDAILSEYPNPDRMGCPGNAVLKELAIGPSEGNFEQDPRWQHLVHCSECYREFLAFRAGVRADRKARRARSQVMLGAALLVTVVGLSLGVRELRQANRPHNPELAFRARVVYLEGVSRSAEGSGDTKPLVFDREPEELTIRLPLTSPEGTYAIQIERSPDKPLISATGQAKMENDATAFTVKIDLSKLEPGGYVLCVRRVPLQPVCHPVVVH